MSIIIKVSEWGNSLAIRLPKAVVEQLGLTAGSEAELELDGNGAVLRRRTVSSRERYDAMIAEMKRLKAAGVEEPETVDWGPDVGDEILPDEDWSHLAGPSDDK